jgi:hypothetical protein
LKHAAFAGVSTAFYRDFSTYFGDISGVLHAEMPDFIGTGISIFGVLEMESPARWPGSVRWRRSGPVGVISRAKSP